MAATPDATSCAMRRNSSDVYEQELLPQRLVVAGHARLFAHDLQGDGLLRRPVVREKDLAHPSLAEALTDLVAVADDRPVRQRRQAAPAALRHCRLDTASLRNIIPRRRLRPNAALRRRGESDHLATISKVTPDGYARRAPGSHIGARPAMPTCGGERLCAALRAFGDNGDRRRPRPQASLA
jgi:hypothetical protein